MLIYLYFCDILFLVYSYFLFYFLFFYSKILNLNSKRRFFIISNLLNPKNDYVFHRIFGYSGNEDITKNFISSIISDHIQEITLDCNPITEKNLLDDKVGILDIKAKLNNNINCNIEMQLVRQSNVIERLLFYWSKMYTSSIHSGNKYKNLKRSIAILISNCNLDKLKEIPEFLTKWNIREEKYHYILLTNVLELYIIELDKVKDYQIDSDTILNSWLQFINNPKEKLKMENKEIKKAKKILQEISEDEHERRLTELREKYIMDQQAIEDYGYDKGLAEGVKQGIEQGIEKTQTNIIKKMQKENFDITVIKKITGLNEDEINKILSSN